MFRQWRLRRVRRKMAAAEEMLRKVEHAMYVVSSKASASILDVLQGKVRSDYADLLKQAFELGFYDHLIASAGVAPDRSGCCNSEAQAQLPNIKPDVDSKRDAELENWVAYLRDPQNGISLLRLAYQAMNGEIAHGDLEQVAAALNHIVDSYKAGMDPLRQFEMSESDILREIDRQRGVSC